MNLYESGAEEMGRILSVVLPSTIKQEIDSVDHYIKRLDRDVQANKHKLTELLADWHLFVEEWTTFRDGAGWFSRTSGATYDKALDYRKRADAWDELLRRRGASSAPAGTTPASVQPTDLVAPILKLAAIGIGAYVGINLLRAFRSSKETP